MDVTKMVDINTTQLPEEVMAAFGWNQKLVTSGYMPMIQAEQRMDGSVSAFITADSKAILFFDDCKANGKVGRILNDEVTLMPFGELVMVLAKASICVDDVVKGTGVAGQTFRIGNVEEMDQCVQFASGIARSRALTNAGYGVVSGVTIPAPGGDPSSPVQSNEPGSPATAGNSALPFRTDNLPGSATGTPASGTAGTTFVGAPASGAVVSPPGGAPVPIDPLAWAKNTLWPAKRKMMGELLAMSPKDIKWAAENIRDNSDVKRAAVALYPDACRALGVAPKQIA